MPLEEAHSLISDFRELVLRTGYYTGATVFLMEQAAALGKTSYVIPNGLNLAQLELSRLAVQEVRQSPDRAELRIGYFSGTLTHQSDFRMIASVLVRLLGEFPNVTLTVAGEFDLAQFPEFAVFADRVEKPFVDWRLLPSEIARAHQPHSPRDQSIHGGQERPEVLRGGPGRGSERSLAHRSLPVLHQTRIKRLPRPNRGRMVRRSPDPDRRSGVRRQMGWRGYRHVLEHYVPRVIGGQALAVYRSVLLDHRRRWASRRTY